MRHLKNVMWFLVGVMLIAVVMIPSAYAQTNLIFDFQGNLVGSYHESVHQTLNDTYGVKDSTSGKVSVKGASGSSVNVPFSAAKQVSKASIAKAAAKIGAKAIPAIGTAYALAELCDLLCPGNDYRVAPDGASMQQIEKPDVAGDAPGTGYYITTRPDPTRSKTAHGACSKQAPAYQVSYPGSTVENVQIGTQTPTGLSCHFLIRGADNQIKYTGLFSIGRQANFYVPAYTLATEVQTEADVLARMEQQSKFKDMYDAIRRDADAAGSNWPSDYNPVKPTTPVVVSASPVSSPERVVSTTTKSLPDGSVDTTTTTEQTVVTPTTTGTTVADSKTTFPSQTVTSSTTINNISNVTTNETTTINHPVTEPSTSPTTPTEFPDDYNREVTQLKIADELAGEGAPELPDLTDKVDTEIEKNKTDLETLFTELPDKFQADKDNWFSWVWTPPIGQCTPSTGTVHGVVISLDPCPTVEKIREAMGFIFALFGAWTIYGEIFKRPV